MVEGYQLEYNDCMVCDYAGGPVLISNEHIIPGKKMYIQAMNHNTGPDPTMSL